MKTTLAERLKEARNARGLTQKALGELIGVSQAAIQKIETGKAVQTTKLVDIARALKVRPEWLGSGLGAMTDDTVPPESEWGKVDAWDKNTPLPDDEVEVPFLKDIEFAAGNGSCTNEDYNGFKLRFSKATLRRIGARTDGSGVLCFPARGNSMEPVIPDGATVAINCDDKRIVDGKVYAINQDGWKRLKLLYRTGPDKLSIRSFNSEEHPPEEVELSNVEVIGRMFWSATLW
ncbi:helix-turn-helix transcriptional regulator [Salmonella enterica subsp. enterica serovar Newport]|uniref:Helix-turn-helix transcriptional regulator n=1 Tax=Salmonella enterica subsp. houtenae serovar 45:g,z51:- TaxID=1967611 RepID=A0A736RFC6_SALHO|nr:helix-turn-helix transcriptional regulator [Salmonella enterica]ECG1392100.1 helix-turn-helix transcriptional regulator [Salmonella enterica subsp. houtenae str. CFSAN000557]ECZ9312548.1 helix-turn-helix transcriptional regulator [Salmonella enterica subsp. enterica serovar Newport]EKO1025279.1 helix-turn-helix transcriptional regulator [Salmonella enterica subsp. enterica]HAE7767757.1 helix-turn-helix transcriptional regulator [Salmonella enterica subsp. houtenae serovar 45:g,z51:-]